MTRFNEQPNPVGYVKLDGKKIKGKATHLSIPTSIELKEKHNREERRCFHNSYYTADEEFDFVGGFLVQGQIAFEHAWNIHNVSDGPGPNCIIDVTTIPHDNAIYVEVCRFTDKEIRKLCSNIKKKNELYFKSKQLKETFVSARKIIHNHFKSLYIKHVY